MAIKRRWACFVSGRGSNLKNVLEIEASKKMPSQKIALVVANKDCPALEHAEAHQKKTLIVSTQSPEFDGRVLAALKEHSVDHIFLLGFMKILSAGFLAAWKQPIVNLHPSLLPKYKGLHAIEKAYEAGDKEVGVSLHEVIEDLDSGKILRQKSLSRGDGWSLERLESEIHRLEHEMVKEFLIDLECTSGLG